MDFIYLNYYKLVPVPQTFLQVKNLPGHSVVRLYPSFARNSFSFNIFKRASDKSETLSGE